MADSALVQRAYTAIITHFIEQGRAPHYTELATLLDVAPDSARDLQRDAAEASPACWLEPETELARSYGFTERDLRRIWMIIDERRTEIRDGNRHFGG